MIENSHEFKKPVVADMYLTPGLSTDMFRSALDHAENVIVVMYDVSIDISPEIASIIETSATPVFVAKSIQEHDALKKYIKEVFDEGKRGNELQHEVRERMTINV